MYKGKRIKKQKIKKIFLLKIFFLLGILISTFFIIKWYRDGKENKKIVQEISKDIIIEKIQENEIKYNINFKSLKEQNSDTVAWIKVYGTKIEYPVVQYKNNKYYLDKNFKKEYNSGGWIFADYKNKFDGTDKNIVLYGHNMKNDTMFATLENVIKAEWYNNSKNYEIEFITEKKEEKYQVFSVYKIKNEDYYINTEFKNGEFEKFINTLKKRSIKDFNVEISSEDSILTLSTCADNKEYRIVLHAKCVNN